MHSTDLDLDAIQARADAATPGPWCTDSWEIYQGTEYVAGAEWIGETCRGRVDGLAQDRADAEFVAAARTDVPALLAEVRRLRASVAELERPAVEAKRNEIRQSFTEIAAQCEQDHDYQAAANFQRRLQEHEEQWKAEDAAAAVRACPGFEAEYQGVSDAKRRLPSCKHCRQKRAAHLAPAVQSRP